MRVSSNTDRTLPLWPGAYVHGRCEVGISKLIERVFGPRTILAQPGYDPTLESRRRTSADFGRGRLPIGKILFFGGASVLLAISVWKMTIKPAQAAAPATVTLIPSPAASPTPLPSTTPPASPAPSKTPLSFHPGSPAATSAGSSPTPVVNFQAVTMSALETLAYAPTGTPVVIIQQVGGGGCSDCGSDPLPTYTPYPTLAPLQALPTYTPLPTYTAVGTTAPTQTAAPTSTPTAQPLREPPGPYRLYLPIVH